MERTWDQEMMRLHHCIIEELQKQNAELRGMLANATSALSQKNARKRPDVLADKALQRIWWKVATQTPE